MPESSIVTQAKLIESLAATMRDSMWASEIDERLRMIAEAAEEIRRIIEPRRGGER